MKDKEDPEIADEEFLTDLNIFAVTREVSKEGAIELARIADLHFESALKEGIIKRCDG